MMKSKQSRHDFLVMYKVMQLFFISIFQINAVRAFALILRRYTGLNHLAQAARAVLHNSAQISQVIGTTFLRL